MYCTLISTNEKKSKKSREGVSTSMGTARHNLPNQYLMKLKLITRLELSISKRVKVGSIL